MPFKLPVRGCPRNGSSSSFRIARVVARPLAEQALMRIAPASDEVGDREPFGSQWRLREDGEAASDLLKPHPFIPAVDDAEADDPAVVDLVRTYR